MNLRNVRVVLTAVYSALTAIIVFALALFAINQGENAIYNNAEREAASMVAAAGAAHNNEDNPNTWSIHPIEKWINEMGPLSVEPPLLTLVESAGTRDYYERFEYRNDTWLAFVHSVDENESLVAALELSPYESDVSSLRWRVWLASIAAVALAALAGWLVAGRALTPARQAAQRQRDFIADAAHELRTPLATVQASASHALSRPRENVEYQQSLGEILAATERAGTGVSELLEMARFEAGQAQPRMAPLRLDLLTEEVAAGIRLDHAVVQAQPSMSILVDADYGLMRQVLETLTRNAVSRSTMVLLSTTIVDKFAILDIIDDGPGFDEEMLPRVFDRFARGDTKGTTGLGMSIAKTIVEAHKGSIEASNRPEGGAVVRIRLPLPKS